MQTSSDAQVRMEHDDKGEWGEVMFVPANSLNQPEVDAPAHGGKGRKGNKGK